MTITRVAIQRAITFLETPPAPVALLPAPPQPVALLPAWTESTLAAMSPVVRKWEEDWGSICEQSARIDALLKDIRGKVKDWEPEVERVELTGGHYLRMGAQMIHLGHPKVSETILAAPGQPDDVHRGEVRAHYLKVKNAPARTVTMSEINRVVNPDKKQALAGAGL